jgi:hypothetical protein
MEAPRITPEQQAADKAFVDNLETHLKKWQVELAWIEKELIDQALIDGKAGHGKSNRYITLEKAEADLKEKVSNASAKLGLINERYHRSGSLAGYVTEVLKISKGKGQ